MERVGPGIDYRPEGKITEEFIVMRQKAQLLLFQCPIYRENRKCGSDSGYCQHFRGCKIIKDIEFEIAKFKSGLKRWQGYKVQ